MTTLMFLLSLGSSTAFAQQAGGKAVRDGYLIQVPLPVTDQVSAKVEQQLRQIAEQVPANIPAAQRPVLVLEFDTVNSATGQGSELGNCLDIANMLTQQEFENVHTVAYIPQARGLGNDINNNVPISHLKGHAVLIALACDEIAMHHDASIGQAGIDIKNDPSLELATYNSIVGRRLRIPLPIARAFVDKSLSLSRVETTDDEFKFMNQDELSQLDKRQINDERTLSNPGELPLFSSEQMQRWQLIDLRVASRSDLSIRLNVDKSALEPNPLGVGEKYNAVQLPIETFVDMREAEWALRMLNNHLNSHPETNLVIVRLNSPGGELDACLRIARELAAMDSGEITTAAYIESQAIGSVSLIATACDKILMATEAELGGVPDVPLTEQELDDSRELIKRFAKQTPIDWSIPMGLIDPELVIFKCSHKTLGQSRLLCEQERASLVDADEWIPGEEVVFSAGIKGPKAYQLGLARALLDDFDQVTNHFQLSATPVQLEPSPADRWLENLARKIATPWIAAWLLFGAVFLLSTEMSNPGIGIPGFLGTICLMLFFWSQYLDGNANWLEILLFVVGLVFVILEVFVLPGFGIFGIGGLLMIVAGIVLASQTFIIPRNSEELARLPVSLSLVLAAGGGFFAGIFFIRKYLTTMPMFRRIMLDPPNADESVSPTQREQRESLVNRGHMVGKSGVAMTPLVPAGKAQIGNELVDVITDGRMIEKNTAIKVVDVIGNRVLVEPEES